jgi:TolA-binding protein
VSLERGIERATDLVYQQDYLEADVLYHKLLAQLDAQGTLNEALSAQRLRVLESAALLNQVHLRNDKQALADYAQLIRLYPKSPEALKARAAMADIYQYRLGRIDLAIEELQKLVLEFPADPAARRAQLQVGQAYFRLKNYDQCRAEAQGLLERWPGTSEAREARFQIAHAYSMQERYADTAATYLQILEDGATGEVRARSLFELGNCHQALGDPQRALAYYYEALPEHPNPLLLQRKIARIRQHLRGLQLGTVHDEHKLARK